MGDNQSKPTKIYGHSDDAVCFEGGIYGQVDAYGTDDREVGVLVVCSDGTVLEAKYGKGGLGIWGVTLLRRGDLFDRIEHCDDEDAQPHSDVAHFRPGLRAAWAAKRWERVK